MKLIVLEGGRAKVLTPEQILAKAARAAGMPDSEFDPQAVARGA